MCCLFLLGCGKANQELDELADRACACKDAACGEQVLEAFVAWAENNRYSGGDEDRAKASGMRLGQCIVTSGVDKAKIMSSMKQVQQ